MEKEKIYLIPNAVDPSYFFPRSKDPTLLESCNLQYSEFIIAYVGSVNYYEGLDNLIEAFAMLLAKRVKAHY